MIIRINFLQIRKNVICTSCRNRYLTIESFLTYFAFRTELKKKLSNLEKIGISFLQAQIVF